MPRAALGRRGAPGCGGAAVVNISRLERSVFWLLPASVLLAAYAGVCVMTGSLWPWSEVVHEDGSRTLLGTVFFVEHASRELVPDAILALAVAGAARFYFPVPRAAWDAGASRLRRRLALLAALTLAGIIGGTYWAEGGRALLDNLSQSHTRSGAPLVWGAHWRYHLIDRFALVMLAFSATGVIWNLRGRPDTHRASGRFWLYGAALVLFLATTVVFRLTSEPFRDPAFLGHQLRELFTHSLVTLPLALGTCLSLARKLMTLDAGPGTLDSTEPAWPIILTGLAAVLGGTYLLVASVLADAQSHGQVTGIAALLWPHFAEHAMGYVLVPVLAGLLYLTPGSLRPGSQIVISPPPSVAGNVRTTEQDVRSSCRRFASGM